MEAGHSGRFITVEFFLFKFFFFSFMLLGCT